MKFMIHQGIKRGTSVWHFESEELLLQTDKSMTVISFCLGIKSEDPDAEFVFEGLKGHTFQDGVAAAKKLLGKE